jgi:hypothetical protein
MKILARRARNTEGSTATVQAWGPDAVGATQVESLLARQGQLLAGFTAPTPAGWGLAGSTATSDSHIWASPQAFTGAGAKTAFSAWTVGADYPTVYPADAHVTLIPLPGVGGI